MSTDNAVSANVYQFGVHQNLSPSELFFYVAVEETCKQLGVDDVEAVVAILCGQNWISTRAKPNGATKGTSVASLVSRKLLNYDLKRKILPTLTNASVKKLKVMMVRNVGTFVGRTVPVVGWVIVSHDVAMIGINTVRHYNRLVKREDRVF
ncbi:STM2901 family protein [Paraburkholderia pallida]|uniref:Uncharacterized protein n=1 Tax=Paraburkholderia pallida TaxID=2547399 RepID=A0A4P7CVX3_9BURK|nr:hypothetical protein [Paraburkholderia pallida]QBR00309.1 hypothetical protein E1956_24960 [Paraburkholderia pallida]